MNAIQINAKIVANEKISKEYYLLTLEVPAIFKQAQPGQFIHIRINDLNYPLLRRPFSIQRIVNFKNRINLRVLYEIKGQGTTLLVCKRPSDTLDILGPLGRGFDTSTVLSINPERTSAFKSRSVERVDYELKDSAKKNHILIAGGAGVAPLLFLAEKLIGLKLKVVALIGAANKNKIICENEFKNLGCDVKISTDDGTAGFKGMVTNLFEKKILAKFNLSKNRAKDNPLAVYACGPEAMLKKLAKICVIKKIHLQVSMEEFMGCGIGACLGCAIETKTGYKRVCHDGPVFYAEDIVWRF